MTNVPSDRLMAAVDELPKTRTMTGVADEWKTRQIGPREPGTVHRTAFGEDVTLKVSLDDPVWGWTITVVGKDGPIREHSTPWDQHCKLVDRPLTAREAALVAVYQSTPDLVELSTAAAIEAAWGVQQGQDPHEVVQRMYERSSAADEQMQRQYEDQLADFYGVHGDRDDDLERDDYLGPEL